MQVCTIAYHFHHPIPVLKPFIFHIPLANCLAHRLLLACPRPRLDVANSCASLPTNDSDSGGYETRLEYTISSGILACQWEAANIICVLEHCPSHCNFCCRVMPTAKIRDRCDEVPLTIPVCGFCFELPSICSVDDTFRIQATVEIIWQATSEVQKATSPKLW